SIAISVTAVNDAPVNSLPGPQSVNEDDILRFLASDGNAISISDVDAGNGAMRVTLSVTHGLLTLASTSGLSFNSGDGTGDPSVQFTGTISAINAALDGLTYAPDANFNGSAA